MPIWTQPISVEELTERHVDTAAERLGIEFLEVGDDVYWKSERLKRAEEE